MSNPIPNNKPFKKGESGNPNGRPKGSRNKSTMYRDILEIMESMTNPLTGDVQNLSLAERLIIVQALKGLDGDFNAYRDLMDSAYGKNPDTAKVDHTTNGDKIESVIVQYVKPKD
jgi:hypothetical protein